MSCEQSRKIINLRFNPINIKKSQEILKFENKQNTRYKNKLVKHNDCNNYGNITIHKNNSYELNQSRNNVQIKRNKEKKNTAVISMNSNMTTKYLNTNATTRENTITSLNSKRTKRKDPFNATSSNNSEYRHDSISTLKDSARINESIEEKRTMAKGPEDEDIKFLYNIFYTYSNTTSFTLNESKNYKKKLNLNDLRNYLIKNEKNFKKEGNILIYQSSITSGLVLDFYFIKKLESLVARFSLIIFIFIRCGRLAQAKDIFLLLIKENKYYIDYIEKKIMDIYSITNEKINILKDYPRMTYELIRIYSFIIKYSQFFNLMNYRNIFLGRYFEILYFIYNFFVHKGNNRMFNLETKNQLNFWFSSALHNASYFAALNYCPMDLSINLSNCIIDMYSNSDSEDNILTDSEKSLMNKTLYNLGLFYYLNGKKDKALAVLDKVKEKIINSDEIDPIDTSFYQMNIKKKESINIIVPKMKKSENNLFSEKIDVKKITPKRNSVSVITKDNNNNNNDEANSKNEKIKSEKSKMVEKIIKGFNKKKNDLEDIILLINYGVKAGIITEKNKETEYRSKFRKIFRGSHINLSTTFRVKDFLVPYYFNNPLLRKIELLMGEIELDKKNFNSSYDHILRAFYILILLKINRTCGTQKEYNNEEKIIDKYFTLIEKYKDEEIKKKERMILEQKSFDDNCNMSSFNNSKNDDSFTDGNNNNNNTTTNNEIYNESNDTFKDKYNLIIDDDSEDKTSEENKEILVCGKQILDDKILKEIEKFFIFLNSLSLFQIKILNETQPDNIKRNDLPILFPSQFKDCLSDIQRIELEKIQTMALSRYVILKNPNKWIMPNNLNIDIIDKSILNEYDKKQNTIYINEDDIENYPRKETREEKYYRKIILSNKINKEIREFINTNYDLVLKILKQSTDEEINTIINFPYIIMEPVKSFKKRRKKFMKLHKNQLLVRDTNSWCNKNKYDFDNYDPFKHRVRLRTYTTSNKKSNRCIKHCFLPEKHIKSNYFEKNMKNKRTRNKSVYSKVPIIEYSEEEIMDNKDYNDSYEDYLLSPENSSFDDKS